MLEDLARGDASKNDIGRFDNIQHYIYIVLNADFNYNFKPVILSFVIWVVFLTITNR